MTAKYLVKKKKEKKRNYKFIPLSFNSFYTEGGKG